MKYLCLDIACTFKDSGIATRLLFRHLKSCWKRQLVFVFFKQPMMSGIRQITKPYPYVASGGTSEIISSSLLALLRKVRTITVGIEYLRIDPLDFSSFWINVPPGLVRWVPSFSPRIQFTPAPLTRERAAREFIAWTERRSAAQGGPVR